MVKNAEIVTVNTVGLTRNQRRALKNPKVMRRIVQESLAEIRAGRKDVPADPVVAGEDEDRREMRLMAEKVSDEWTEEIRSAAGRLHLVREQFQEEAVAAIRASISATIRSPEFRRALAETIAGAAKEVAKEILAEDTPHLEAEVRALVRARFGAEVEKAAHELLDARLADIKKRIG